MLKPIETSKLGRGNMLLVCFEDPKVHMQIRQNLNFALKFTIVLMILGYFIHWKQKNKQNNA